MSTLHQQQDEQQNNLSLWQRGIQRALKEGVIAVMPHVTAESVSWSTLVLTFIGALVSATLFLVALFLFFALLNVNDASIFYVLSLLLIGGGVGFLRLKPQASLFLELVMFIFSITGLVLLTVTLLIESRGGSEWIFLFMALLILICACIVPANWMRASGSFVSAIFLYIFILEVSDYSALGRFASIWFHPLLAFILIFVGRYCEKHIHWKLLSFLEPLIQGWLAITLLLLAYASGRAMFMAQFIPLHDGDVFWGINEFSLWEHLKYPVVWMQIACLPLAFLWARTQNAFFKEAKVLLLVAVLTFFTLIQPLLSLCLAISLLLYLTNRMKMAILGCLCALWIVGSIYYLLSLPLLEKSIWFAVTGAVLLAIALWGRSSAHHESASPSSQHTLNEKTPFANRRMVNMALVVVAAVVALGGVNASIWKQEQLRGGGVQVLIQLAPVDPRSLMQGDYMALNFSVPAEISFSEDGKAYLVMDAQGIGRFVATPEDNAVPFLLENKRGRWSVPEDAWFFKEGDAKRWEAARYGIFKVNALGRSSLIGMADAELKPIDLNNDVR